MVYKDIKKEIRKKILIYLYIYNIYIYTRPNLSLSSDRVWKLKEEHWIFGKCRRWTNRHLKLQRQQDHICTSWNASTSNLSIFGHIWTHLAWFGQIWSHLGIFGHIWPYLAIWPGHIWPHLDTFGHILANFALVWWPQLGICPKFVHLGGPSLAFGQFGPILTAPAWHWPKFIHFGRPRLGQWHAGVRKLWEALEASGRLWNLKNGPTLSSNICIDSWGERMGSLE